MYPKNAIALGQIVYPSIQIHGHYEFHQKKIFIEFVFKSHVLGNKFYICVFNPYKLDLTEKPCPIKPKKKKIDLNISVPNKCSFENLWSGFRTLELVFP